MHEIAKKRSLVLSTISSHLERLILDGEDVSVDSIVDPEKQRHIKQALKRTWYAAAESCKGETGRRLSYEEIRLVRAKMMREGEKEM